VNKDEVLKELKDKGYPEGKQFGRSKELKELKKSIYDLTLFLPEKATTSFRLHCLIENIENLPICKECGNKHSKIKQNPNRIRKYDSYVFCDYCSQDCSRKSKEAREKGFQTIVYRYGNHNMRTEKGRKEYEESLMKKYGTTNIMKLPYIAEKSLKTADGKWRVCTEDFKEKQKITWSANYEKGHPMRDSVVLENRRKKTLEKYGVENHTQKHMSEETIRILSSKEELEFLYNKYKDMGEVAKVLGIHRSSVQRSLSQFGSTIVPVFESKGEREIISFLDELGVSYERHYRFDPEDKRKSVDIYIESCKLAIEYNGVYYHSMAVKDDKGYHQNKSLRLIELGILPLHIWEDDWNNPIKKEILKNKIKAKLGLSQDRVYARKCEVAFIDYHIAHDFLDNHHIQGKTTATYWIGLFSEGTLVSCCGIKKLNEDGKFDLVRYATSKSVVGGLSKILKFFERNIPFKEIITYAHLDYSKGDLYEKTGFTKVSITPPGMWYVIKEKRQRREKFMKHKLNDIFDDFDPSLTERENMEKHGYYQIFDSGSIKYKLEKAPL